MGTTNKNLETPAYNSTLWNVPLNSNFGIIDSCFGTSSNVALSGSDVTLSATQIQSLRINVTGNIGSNKLNIIIPDGVGGSWIFTNNTSYSGGTVSVRTASYTIAAVALAGGGSSTILYSDGANVYSAVSGSTGSYVPTSGGTITGSLAINTDLTVSGITTLGTSTFLNDTTLNTGKTLTVNGTLAFSPTTGLSAGSLALGGATIGTNKLAVQGTTNLSGDVTVSSGNISLTTGNFISSSSATNQFGGTTNIPSAATLNIQSGGTLSIASGGNFNILGTFAPSSINMTGAITTTGAISGGSLTTGSGAITGGTITGTTFTTASTFASINNAGLITGTGLSLGSGAISAGAISGASVSTTGAISGASISTTGGGGITGGAITGTSLSAGSGTISTTSTSSSAISATSGGVTAKNVTSTAAAYFNNGIYVNNTGSAQTSFSLTGSSSSMLMTYNSASAFSFNAPSYLAYTGTGGAWVDGSDERIKDNIKTIIGATELVRKMRGVSFNYKSNGAKSYGVVAQELQKVIPDVVYELEGSLYVNYSIFAGFFIEAIKELEARIAELEAAP